MITTFAVALAFSGIEMCQSVTNKIVDKQNNNVLMLQRSDGQTNNIPVSPEDYARFNVGYDYCYNSDAKSRPTKPPMKSIIYKQCYVIDDFRETYDYEGRPQFWVIGANDGQYELVKINLTQFKTLKKDEQFCVNNG